MDLARDVDLAVPLADAAQARQGNERRRPVVVEWVEALPGFPDRAEADVSELLERVRLPAARATRFPGELSGGERPRVAIARALVARPDLVVCDEITSALDVSVQAAVLDLLAELRAELGLSLLFISHDLGVVASVADRVLVLDQGRVCEEGPVSSVVADPQNPYTRELLASAPRVEHAASS